MARYIEAPLAKQDLAEIIQYIARDNPDAAERFLAQVMEHYQQVADNVEMGRRRSEIAPEMRTAPFGDYIIFYQPIRDGVAIARFLHGARDIEEML
jgi:toxin ParE1/3/4